MTTQPGIFALGTSEHCYLELDLLPDHAIDELVVVAAELDDPLSTTGGVNLVAGFRPELWAQLASDHTVDDLTGFNRDIVGADGFRMPATQHDAWLWVAGGNRTAVFDNALTVIRAMAGIAVISTEVTGWLYHYDRDLTGFIDGTENPSLREAPSVATVPTGPAAGGSVVLVQQWQHDTDAFEALTIEQQEQVMGRSKADSVEFDEAAMPATAHVARTTLEEDGEELPIFRRNTAYGTATDHGTMFIGFSQDLRRLVTMLERMAGSGDGVRDALTRFTTPLTGAYYFVPSVEAINRLLGSTQGVGSSSPTLSS